MLTDEQIKSALRTAETDWNARADAFNQWSELGQDERCSLFANAILAASECCDRNAVIEECALHFEDMDSRTHLAPGYVAQRIRALRQPEGS